MFWKKISISRKSREAVEDLGEGLCTAVDISSDYNIGDSETQNLKKTAECRCYIIWKKPSILYNIHK